MRVIADLLARRTVSEEEDVLTERDVARAYEAHAPFVYASLQRLGVRPDDLEDLLHEVFVVVQKRVHTFDRSSKPTTWLFGICMRVASAYRRRGFRRNELAVAEPPEQTDAAPTPEQDLATAESRRRLEELLDELDLEKRAVFVMFEIDEMPCEEIATIIGVPIGTVYSRLHAARKSFQHALARMHARDARGAR
jgi:RNA polymerase sigma-70 factor, ECF subfamily